MSKTKPTTIRMSHDLRERVDRAAEKLGFDEKGGMGAVVKLALHNQLPEIEAGRLTLKAD